MTSPPAAIPPHWLMCKTARAFRASVHDMADAQTVFQNLANPESAGEKLMPVRKLVERPDGTAVDGEWYAQDATLCAPLSARQHAGRVDRHRPSSTLLLDVILRVADTEPVDLAVRPRFATTVH